jgi:hypothetical protein
LRKNIGIGIAIAQNIHFIINSFAITTDIYEETHSKVPENISFAR